MANRRGDVDLREARVSAPQLELWLGFGLDHCSVIRVCLLFFSLCSSGFQDLLRLKPQNCTTFTTRRKLKLEIKHILNVYFFFRAILVWSDTFHHLLSGFQFGSHSYEICIMMWINHKPFTIATDFGIAWSNLIILQKNKNKSLRGGTPCSLGRTSWKHMFSPHSGTL
jgi:hypothetical protein